MPRDAANRRGWPLGPKSPGLPAAPSSSLLAALPTPRADRLSFRQFLSMGPVDTAFYDTTLMKFRKRVCDKGLFDRLFAEEWT